jgi:hypothetical protein
MIEVPHKVNDRRILYMDIADDLKEFAGMTLTNWMVFVITDESKLHIMEPFAELCIDKGVQYMCATGKAGSAIDHIFDIAMVMRQIEGRPLQLWYTKEEDCLMTTWDEDFEEGFWFATSAAFYDDLIMETVVVVNFTTESYYDKIVRLSEQINSGWLPSD